MDKIKAFVRDEATFAWGTVWIKNPIFEAGAEPYRYRATDAEQVTVINNHLKNYAIEELTLFSDQYIRPMFDKDSYDVPIDTEKDKEMIRHIFKDAEIKVAAREPRMKNGKMFYSKRYYVKDRRIRANQLHDLIKWNTNIPNDYFDLSKYGKGGQFFTLFNTRKHHERNVPPLVPEDDPNPNILDYYASYVLKEYKDYDEWWEACDTYYAHEKEIKSILTHKEDDEGVVLQETTEIDDIINHISPKRAAEYPDWSKTVFGMINYGVRIKLNKNKIKGLIHAFSAKCEDKYDEDRVDEWIKNNLKRIMEDEREIKLGRNYLINVCLKEDDYKYWSEKYRYRDYKAVLNVLNNECIKVRMNKRWLIFRKVDNVNKEPYYLFEKDQVQHYYGTKEDFCFNFKNDKGEKEVCNIVNTRTYWTDVNMKCYDNIIYAPCYDGVLAAEYFNTWDGWNAMKYKVCKDYSKCEVLLKHLKEVWCSDDEVLYKWFLEYLSVIVRGGRTCVVPIVEGKQKCGKDCFMTDLIMNRIMGLKYCLTTNDPINQVFGRFNNALLNKSLVVMAEGGYDLNACYEKFKDIITNAVLRIEGKFIDIVSATNYTNFIISTNKYDIIKGDKGMDQRRIIYIKCSNRYLGNKTYFDNLYKNGINNDDAVSAFYHYLIDADVVKQVPLDDLSYLQETKPETKITKDISAKNTPIVSQFLYEYFKEDTLNEYVKKIKGVAIKRPELYAKYKAYVENNGFERLKLDLFSSQLLNYHGIECKKREGIFYYVFVNQVLQDLKEVSDKMEKEGEEWMEGVIIHTDRPSYVDEYD